MRQNSQLFMLFMFMGTFYNLKHNMKTSLNPNLQPDVVL